MPMTTLRQMSKMKKTSAISRDEALKLAHNMRKRIDFFTENPTAINEADFKKLSDTYDSLREQHRITDDDLDGTPAPKKEIRPTSTEPVDLEQAYYSQPEVQEEEEMNRANGLDRNSDFALPFKIGYNFETGQIDRAGLFKTISERKAAFDNKHYEGVDPSIFPDIREAEAMGINPQTYIRARSIGASHDYLTQAHVMSLRPHTIQLDSTPLNSEREGIGKIQFSETPVGEAVKNYIGYMEANGTPMYTRSESTDIEPASGFTPIRFACIRPFHAGLAEQKGVTVGELTDAWHNNGFHPLAQYSSDHTLPITKYIVARDMGIDHQTTRRLLSSVQHIPLDSFKGLMIKGHSPEEILGGATKFKQFEMPQSQENPQIGE